MYSFKQYISEGLKIKLIRGKTQDVLKMQDTKEKSWVEVRGKSNFETKFDPKDPLHKAIAALRKSVNVSELVNGEPVGINPNHPHGKKALAAMKKLMK
jgi:hypothetical protein